MPVDDTKTGSSQCSRHVRAAGVKCVRYRVILPHLTKRRIDIARVISTHKVDLAVEIARSHEGTYVGHGRSGTPGVSSDIVDARSINYQGEGDLFTAEDEDLVHVGRIHRRSLGVVQIRHNSKRCPSIRHGVKTREVVDVIADRERITAALIPDGAIAIHEPAVVIYRYRSCLRPRPRRASSWCAAGCSGRRRS